MPTGIPYSWYRDNFISGNVDDAGIGSRPMSEEDWNRLSQNERLGMIGTTSYGPNSNDPLLQQIMQRYQGAGFGGQDVRNVSIYNNDKFIDPSRVFTDQETGTRWTPQENMREYQNRLTPLTGILTVLTAGMAANAGLLGAGVGEGASSAAPGWASTYGAETAGGALSGGASGLGASAAAGLSGAPALMSHVPSSQFNSMLDGSSSLFNVPESGGLFSGLTDSLTSPSGLLRLAGTGQTLAGLFGGDKPSGNSGSSGNNGPGKGGGGGSLNLQRDPYTPNAITMAQLQNMQYARPPGGY